jgi:hypothetical protein
LEQGRAGRQPNLFDRQVDGIEVLAGQVGEQGQIADAAPLTIGQSMPSRNDFIVTPVRAA